MSTARVLVHAHAVHAQHRRSPTAPPQSRTCYRRGVRTSAPTHAHTTTAAAAAAPAAAAAAATTTTTATRHRHGWRLIRRAPARTRRARPRQLGGARSGCVDIAERAEQHSGRHLHWAVRRCESGGHRLQPRARGTRAPRGAPAMQRHKGHRTSPHQCVRKRAHGSRLALLTMSGHRGGNARPRWRHLARHMPHHTAVPSRLRTRGGAPSAQVMLAHPSWPRGRGRQAGGRVLQANAASHKLMGGVGAAPRRRQNNTHSACVPPCRMRWRAHVRHTMRYVCAPPPLAAIRPPQNA